MADEDSLEEAPVAYGRRPRKQDENRLMAEVDDLPGKPHEPTGDQLEDLGDDQNQDREGEQGVEGEEEAP